MEIIISGTKRGWNNNLYSTSSENFNIEDIRITSSTERPLGQSLYSIAYNRTGCLFSKYVAVRDTLRSKGVGYMGFSLFLDKKKHIQGYIIKSILDKISLRYRQDYIIRNNNNRGEDSIYIHENWDFVEEILKEYRNSEEDSYLNNHIPRGNKEGAAIYYTDDSELENYFSEPFQRDYQAYKRVYFIEAKMKGASENPLNNFKHSEDNLTGKVNPLDIEYTLSYRTYFEGGVHVSIKINSRTPSINRIKKSDELDITWTKPYHKTENKKGRISELESNILNIDEKTRNITIKEISLQPELFKVEIEVEKYNRKKVDNARVLYSNTDKQIREAKRNGTLYVAEFEGEEAAQKWEFIAKNGRTKRSETKNFIPKNIQSIQKLILNEEKEVEILLNIDNGEKIIDFDPQKFKLIVDGKRKHVIEGKVTLRNEELDKKLRYDVRSNIYGSNSEYYQYRRDREENIVQFNLKNLPPAIPPPIRQPKPKNSPKASKKLLYKEPKFLAGITTGLILILAFVLLYPFNSNTEDNKETFSNSTSLKDSIINYVEGDKLFLSMLNDYRDKWEKDNSMFPKESNKEGLLRKLRNINLFSSLLSRSSVNIKKEPQQDTTDAWKAVKKKLDNAIKIREAINSFNFDTLKTTAFIFSKDQLPFQDKIVEIDTSSYEDIRKKLKDQIDSLSLDEIINEIDTILEKSTNVSANNIDNTCKSSNQNKDNAPLSRSTSKNTPNMEDVKAPIGYLDKTHLQNIFDKNKSFLSRQIRNALALSRAMKSSRQGSGLRSKI